MDGIRPLSRVRSRPLKQPEIASTSPRSAWALITPIRSGPEHVKFTPVSGGLKMQVRGAHAVQVFWLYTTRPEEVIEEITRKWQER